MKNTLHKVSTLVGMTDSALFLYKVFPAVADEIPNDDEETALATENFPRVDCDVFRVVCSESNRSNIIAMHFFSIVTPTV